MHTLAKLHCTMFVLRNPAVEAFVAELGPERVLAEVCIWAATEGHELRHVADRAVPASELRTVAINELRELAQFSKDGAFRPLKSAPNLVSGWRAHARNVAELARALDQLYPGAIADWYAARTERPPATHYREFTSRQSGMYRITAMLPDRQAADMIRACCHVRFCLKRRCWTVEGLAADDATEKSMIPCLEPCAILLEFARKAMRLEQEEKVEGAFSVSELETMGESLEAVVATSGSIRREADFNAPDNPRRRQLVLHRIQRMLSEAASRRPPPGDSEH